MRRKQTSGFPRVNCLAPGCKRGTTRIEPGANGFQGEWICAHHWRTVPKTWRQRLSLYRRRYSRAVDHGDDLKAQSAARCYWSRWDRIAALVRANEGETGLPLDLETELRRDGLI